MPAATPELGSVQLRGKVLTGALCALRPRASIPLVTDLGLSGQVLKVLRRLEDFVISCHASSFQL